MTPTKTPFAGYEVLGPSDPLSSDGYRFQGADPRTADRMAKLGAVTHRHDAHLAMLDPTIAPVVTSDLAGGTIPAGMAIFVTYTLTDPDGGETLPVHPAISLTTAAGFSPPTNSPTAVVDYAAGALLAGVPAYALTVTDGAGGETVLGPPTLVTIDPGHALAEVTLSGFAAIVTATSGGAAGAGWRLWRQQGGGPWYLLGSGTDDGFLDNGVAGDCTVTPPATSTTRGTNTLDVTVPGGQPVEAVYFSIYASPDGSFTSPALLGTYPIADADVVQTFTALTVSTGAPPPVSGSLPGANLIDPDSDILDYPWKRPVATEADLPTVGNVDGDMREATDSHTLYAWDAGTTSWIAGGGVVGPEGPAGPDGPDGPTGTRGSLWYAGHGAPGAVAGAQDQDFYVDVDTLNYYSQLAGAWTLEGVLVSGGSRLVACDFTFDSFDLLTGVVAYTPTPGDVLLDAWFEVDTAWDGTTPLADLYSGAGALWSTYDTSKVDMTVATPTLGGLKVPASGRDLYGGGLAAVPTFIDDTPLTLVVSQDGTPTGADPASTQGAARLYILVATPVVTNLPSSFVHDTFTDADGTELTAHVGETGAAWTMHPSGDANSSLITSDQLRRGDAFTAENRAFASGVPTSPDYTVTADFVAVGAGDHGFVDVWARLSETDNTGYMLRYETTGYTSGPPQFELYAAVAGGFTSLGTYPVAAPQTATLSVVGDAIKVIIGGVAVIDVTDGSVTDAGMVGIGGGTDGAGDATDGVWLDNLVAVTTA